jgi:hypothetical protein
MWGGLIMTRCGVWPSLQCWLSGLIKHGELILYAPPMQNYIAYQKVSFGVPLLRACVYGMSLQRLR